MNAFCGWMAFGEPLAVAESRVEDRARAGRVAHALRDCDAVDVEQVSARGAAIAMTAGRLSARTTGRTGTSSPQDLSVFSDESILAIIAGTPRWNSSKLAGDAEVPGDASRFARQVHGQGIAALDALHDSFAVACIDARASRLLLAVDRLGTIPLYFAERGPVLAFGTSPTAVLAALDLPPVADWQAVQLFLAFSCIPSPYTGFANVRASLPGEYLWVEGSVRRRGRYWHPTFREYPPEATATHAELRERLAASVARSLAAGAAARHPAAFLSGGIDSTSILTLMTQSQGEVAHAYTLGHDGASTDERAYARIAAASVGAELHECVVTSDRVAAAIRDVAQGARVPCGNISAPSLLILTRQAAADGVTLMVGGDGGDELFAGNRSYQVQRTLARWQAIPPVLRQRVIEPLVRLIPPTVPMGRRARGYIRRASAPPADRLLNWRPLHEFGATRLLSDDLLSTLDLELPAVLLRESYQEVDAHTLLARHLATDWRFILHGNDLPRVRLACDLAGVALALPMLADDVVDVAMRVPAAERMTRSLRTFYKAAFRGILPREILDKPKQGEGIPVDQWLRRRGALQDTARAALESLRARRLVRASVLDRVIDSPTLGVEEVPAALLYLLVMLEGWLAHHVDAPARRAGLPGAAAPRTP
jgi:asparagine synthase (glutamine-hydrolysing)